jgi:N utilization substance protein B
VAPRKASDKSARTRAREFALQALYQHLVGHNEAAAIDRQTGVTEASDAHASSLPVGLLVGG